MEKASAAASKLLAQSKSMSETPPASFNAGPGLIGDPRNGAGAALTHSDGSDMEAPARQGNQSASLC